MVFRDCRLKLGNILIRRKLFFSPADPAGLRESAPASFIKIKSTIFFCSLLVFIFTFSTDLRAIRAFLRDLREINQQKKPFRRGGKAFQFYLSEDQ